MTHSRPSRLPLLAALCLGMATGAIASAESLQVPIEFKDHGDLEGYRPSGSRTYRLGRELPTGEWKLPTFVDRTPLYCQIELGDSRFLVAFDSLNESRSTYDRVYFDQNGNGDLTDDEPLEGLILHDEEKSTFTVTFYDHVYLEYQLDGKTLPYVLLLKVTGMDFEKLRLTEPEKYGFGSHTDVRVSAGCCYAGQFELGDRTYQVRLGDEDCDGRFDEKRRPSGSLEVVSQAGMIITSIAREDRLYLTRHEWIGEQDMLPLGDHLVLGDQLFECDVNIVAGILDLAAVSQDLLPVELPHATERLVIHSRGLTRTIMMCEPGAEVRLPPGEYQLHSYSMLGEGENGDLWRLRAFGTADSPYVALNENGGAVLPLGEPFTAGATIDDPGRRLHPALGSRPARLGFYLRGAGGERVGDLAHLSGESSVALSRFKAHRPLEPSFTVFKSDGEQVGKGIFEYG